ncbi:MAG: hypothetical protein QW803_05700 [Candidatus Methanomethylicia archaeon]
MDLNRGKVAAPSRLPLGMLNSSPLYVISSRCLTDSLKASLGL